jgi:hypothetical protein
MVIEVEGEQMSSRPKEVVWVIRGCRPDLLELGLPWDELAALKAKAVIT